MISVLILLCGCGTQKEAPAPAEKSADISETAQEDVSEQEEPDGENIPDEEPLQEGSTEAPVLILHRQSAYEWGEDSTPKIKHHFSYLSLDEEYAADHKGLADALGKAGDEILPGAFIALGYLMVLFNKFLAKK